MCGTNSIKRARERIRGGEEREPASEGKNARRWSTRAKVDVFGARGRAGARARDFPNFRARATAGTGGDGAPDERGESESPRDRISDRSARSIESPGERGESTPKDASTSRPSARRIRGCMVGLDRRLANVGGGDTSDAREGSTRQSLVAPSSAHDANASRRFDQCTQFTPAVCPFRRIDASFARRRSKCARRGRAIRTRRDRRPGKSTA